MSGQGQDPRWRGIGSLRNALQSYFTGPLGQRHFIYAAAGVVAVLAAVGLFRFGTQLDDLRQRHATGPSWAFPSRVYSDGLVFSRDRAMPRSYLAKRLAARRYRHVQGATPVPGTYTWRDDGVEIFLRGFTDAADPQGRGGPERVRVILEEDRVAGVARLTTPRGTLPRDTPEPDLMRPARLKPWPIAMLAEPNGARRTWVPLSSIPKVVRNAVIASEDRRFRSHFGLDLQGNLRALLVNARAGEVRQGASTITQQLARGLFLGRERTFARKLKEAGYAVLIEMFLSKDQILEMYLNSIYWGQGDTRAVAGIEEAARWYFSAPAESLQLSEAAVLAGLIPAPVAYSPFRNPDFALARRNQVLAMAEVGFIDARTAARARAPSALGAARDDARRSPPRRDERGRPRPRSRPPRRRAAALGPRDPHDDRPRLAAGGRARGARGPGRPRSRGLRGRRAPLQGAFVAIDPTSGAMRAIVGGRAQRPGAFNRAMQARRQTGSAIKPLVYAVALDPTRGAPYFTLRSRMPDLPKTFRERGVVWTPANSDHSYHASLTLPEALARSANVATANLVEAIGPAQIARGCERFGLGKLKPVLSIGLGSNEATLVDLTNAYAALDFNGLRHRPHIVRAAVDAEGRDLVAVRPPPVRAVPSGVATLTRMMLENVVANGISRPLRWAYGFERTVGGKTGTTNENRDTWYCGITPELAAGVWCGYDRPRGLGRAAAGVAMPVWARAMNRMLADFPETAFADDPGVVQTFVDARSDSVARPDCPWRVPTAFVAGMVPDTCRTNHRADWDAIIFMRVRTDSLAGIEDSIGTTSLRLPGAPPFTRPPIVVPATPADSARPR